MQVEAIMEQEVLDTLEVMNVGQIHDLGLIALIEGDHPTHGRIVVMQNAAGPCARIKVSA